MSLRDIFRVSVCVLQKFEECSARTTSNFTVGSGFRLLDAIQWLRVTDGRRGYKGSVASSAIPPVQTMFGGRSFPSSASPRFRRRRKAANRRGQRGR